MAVNVYLMPRTGTGDISDPFRAAYVYLFAASEVEYAAIDYGHQPVFLVAARDVPPEVHSQLAAQADCVVVPDLSQQVGAQVTAVRNRLEALHIPSQWVVSTTGYGSLVRVVATFFLFAQKLQAQGLSPLLGGAVNLDTQFGTLDAGQQTAILTAATELGLSTEGLGPTTTLRQVWRTLSTRWPAVSIRMGPLVA